MLILVSGAGQPRDIKANPHDNSTEGTAKIIQKFVETVYPDIEVCHISSASLGIFRYDDNMRFVKEEVLPVIDAQRTLALQAFGENWPQNLNVTMCLADGAPPPPRSRACPPLDIVRPAVPPACLRARRGPAGPPARISALRSASVHSKRSSSMLR